MKFVVKIVRLKFVKFKEEPNSSFFHVMNFTEKKIKQWYIAKEGVLNGIGHS